MKTIGRVVILLIAALIVAGAIYAITQTSATALIGNFGGEGESSNRPAPPEFSGDQSELPAVMGERPQGGPQSGLQFATLGRNLLIVGALVLAIQVLRSLTSHAAFRRSR